MGSCKNNNFSVHTHLVVKTLSPGGSDPDNACGIKAWSVIAACVRSKKPSGLYSLLRLHLAPTKLPYFMKAWLGRPVAGDRKVVDQLQKYKY